MSDNSYLIKDGAYRIVDRRASIDYNVSFWDGMPKITYDNERKRDVISYPFPMTLVNSNENSISNDSVTNFCMTGVYNHQSTNVNSYLGNVFKDGSIDPFASSVANFMEKTKPIADEFCIGDHKRKFNLGYLPMYTIFSAEDDEDEIIKTTIRINDNDMDIDIKVITKTVKEKNYSLFTSSDVSQKMPSCRVHEVYNLRKRNRKTKKFMKLDFETYNVTVPGKDSRYIPVKITFVRKSCGKFFAGLIHGPVSSSTDKFNFTQYKNQNPTVEYNEADIVKTVVLEENEPDKSKIYPVPGKGRQSWNKVKAVVVPLPKHTNIAIDDLFLEILNTTLERVVSNSILMSTKLGFYGKIASSSPQPGTVVEELKQDFEKDFKMEANLKYYEVKDVFTGAAPPTIPDEVYLDQALDDINYETKFNLYNSSVLNIIFSLYFVAVDNMYKNNIIT